MITDRKSELHALYAAVAVYTLFLLAAAFAHPGVGWADLMVSAGLKMRGVASPWVGEDYEYSPNVHGLLGWWFIGVAVMLLLWDLVRSYDRKRTPAA